MTRDSRLSGNAGLCLATLVATGLAAGPALGAAPASSAPPGICSNASPGVVATLGTWEPGEDSFTRPERFGKGEESLLIQTNGLDSGLGRFATGRSAVPAALRAVRSGGRVRRLELCHGRTLLATVTRPDPRATIGGVSVNGDRIAWRSWRPKRPGTLAVGRISGRRVVGIRTTTVPVLSPAQRFNGRILVMPDGTASWSVAKKGVAAVWLWPAGRTPRELQLPDGARRRTNGWNVRIVDDRHVLLDDTAYVLRYGPTTPGRCPTPVGATTQPFAGRQLIRVAQTDSFLSTDFARWSQTLLCDPVAGDYTHVHASSGSGDKYGNGSGGAPLSAIATAGVIVQTDGSVGDPSFFTSDITTTGTNASSTAYGTVDGVRPRIPSTPAQQIAGVRILPGAVAWVSSSATSPTQASDSAARQIWLADQNGVRTVGDVTSAVKDPALTLTPTTVTWSAGATANAAPVTPADPTIDRVDFAD